MAKLIGIVGQGRMKKEVMEVHNITKRKGKNHSNIINYFNYHSFNISGRILSLCVFTCGVIGRRWNNCFKEWNLYTYCGGNPINYVDPSGHKLTPKQKAVKI